MQKFVLTLLKIALAVAGICFVTLNFSVARPPAGESYVHVLGLFFAKPAFHWSDTGYIPANGPPINTVTFVQDTLVTVLETQTDATGRVLVRIRFPNYPVKVRIDMPDGPQEMDLLISEDTIIPGTHEHLALRHEIQVTQQQLMEEKISNLDKGEYVRTGLASLFHTAGGKWPLLVAAWAILVIPFVVTAIRWRNLMRPQGIEMPLGKCLQLTFVGQFYSIMLPGITGGDLVKIVYAARLTGSKTKSFITILLDRVIGLVALMVIAGTSAGVQILLNRQAGVPSDNTLVNVFVMILALLLAIAAGATVYFSRRLRKLVGLEWFVEHLDAASANEAEGHAKLEHLFRVANGLALVLAMGVVGVLAAIHWGVHLPWAQNNTPIVFLGLAVAGVAALAAGAGLMLHARLVERLRPLMGKAAQAVVSVDDTLHVYRGHFGLLGWAFVISVVSQLTLPLSAWFCGQAFGMTSPLTHYLAYVPVAVLAASLPVSPPQGFGVMEVLVVQFFRWTARSGQSIMLVQGIRFLPILWNLVGGYWVVTGKYSRDEELPKDDSDHGKPLATGH